MNHITSAINKQNCAFFHANIFYINPLWRKSLFYSIHYFSSQRSFHRFPTRRISIPS